MSPACPCGWSPLPVPRGMPDTLALSALLDHQANDCLGVQRGEED